MSSQASVRHSSAVSSCSFSVVCPVYSRLVSPPVREKIFKMIKVLKAKVNHLLPFLLLTHWYQIYIGCSLCLVSALSNGLIVSSTFSW